VLEPVVARYRGTVMRLYFRGDAAFANPAIYEFLEGEGIGYAIRLPANRVLQERIGYLLKRPVGRPPLEVRRYYGSFGYQAQSWRKPRRVVAKVEWHPGELYPRVGFIVTDLARPAERVVAFYNQRGTAENWIKEGEGAIKWTRLSCRTFVPHPVARARLQPGQLHADAGDAQAGGAMVTDEPAGEADQDWRKGRQPWPLRDVPDGRGRRVAAHVQGHPDAYCSASGAARTRVRGAEIECDKQRRQGCAVTKGSNKFYAPRGGTPSIPLPAAPIAVRAFCHGRPKTRQWRSPVPQSEEKLFPKCELPHTSRPIS
jgi:Transposase DDE domain group 1